MIGTNKSGGGSKTNKNGLSFEDSVDIEKRLISMGYLVAENSKNKTKDVYCEDKLVAILMPKHSLYSYLKDSHGVDWKDRMSSRLLPDNAILNIDSNTIYCIEVKYQNSHGSVDEKLQTCSFKKMMLEKLVSGTGLSVEYVYLLNDWFNKPKYDDVKEFIICSHCHYFIGSFPISFIGL